MDRGHWKRLQFGSASFMLIKFGFLLLVQLPILHSWSLLHHRHSTACLNLQDTTLPHRSLKRQSRFPPSILRSSEAEIETEVLPSSSSTAFFTYNYTNNDDWIQYLNDGIILQDITVQYTPLPNHQSLRGIKAVSALDYEQPVVSIPLDLCLEVTNVARPSPHPQIINQTLWDASLWYHRLAYELLYDYLIKKNPLNYQWYERLPRNFSTPIHWQGETILELQYPSLEKKISTKLYEYLFYYQEWKYNLRGIITENKYRNKDTLRAVEVITVDQFIWALECIQSRSFSGIYEGSSYKDRIRYLLFVAVFSLSQIVFQIGDNGTIASIAIAVLFSTFLKDFFFSKFGNFKRYVFAPVIDLFNHQSTSQSDVSYNYFLNRMELFLKPSASSSASASSSTLSSPSTPSGGRGSEVGSELFINYGFQSNDRFLLHYGFIEENNPHDVYDFDQNIIELLLTLDKVDDNDEGIQPAAQTQTRKKQQQLQQKKKEVSIPVPPSPPSAEDRIRFLSNLFTSLAPVDVSAASTIKAADGSSSVQNENDRPKATSKALIKSEENKRTVKYHRTIPRQWKEDKLIPVLPGGQVEIVVENLKSVSNPTLTDHFDGITTAILKALYSSPEEWSQLFAGVIIQSSNQLDESTANQLYQKIQQFGFKSDTVKRIESTLRLIIDEELASKPTTIEEDALLLNSLQEKIQQNPNIPTEALALEQAIQFRIEKKKLLFEGQSLVLKA